MRTLFLCGAGNPEGVRLALDCNHRDPRFERIVLLDDDAKKHGSALLGVAVTGPLAALADARAPGDAVVNLVARTAARRWTVRERLQACGVPFASLIDPRVDRRWVETGTDVIVYQSAFLGALSRIGEGSVVFMGGIVGHGSTLGSCCIIGPNAVVNARVQLGDGVYVGSNATILPEVKVGAWATIAAGSLVARDVPSGATVMGVPARTVLTLDVKLRLGEFKCLPATLGLALAHEARRLKKTRAHATLTRSRMP